MSADAAEPEGGWRQHMPLDVEHRRSKAQKIISILRAEQELRSARVLEIGTGTGVIASELANAVGPSGSVVSIDTMDTRIDAEGYEFRLTKGVELPFNMAEFDVVITNHVVEHVGNRAAQGRHLAEIARVLTPRGVGYLATPNRWALVEPHFRVPLLSWPPRGLRTALLRLSGRGKAYDVDPYGPRELRSALEEAGLRGSDRSLAALDEWVRLERPNPVIRVVARLPEALRRPLRNAMPTMIYVVRPR